MAVEPSLPFVHSVELRNYKSIARCAVDLGSLTLLLGRNASGKSNFLDSLCFVRDAVEHSLKWALRTRGELRAIRYRQAAEDSEVSILLRLRHRDQFASYGFALVRDGEVASESFEIYDDGGQVVHSFERFGDEAHIVVDGEPYPHLPTVSSNRLYLGNVGGIPEFELFYEALISMDFYDFVPATLRELRKPGPEESLRASGSNATTVLRQLEEEAPKVVDRIVEYLGLIVPGLTGMRVINVGSRETIEFDMTGKHGKVERFEAASMSDGTLRILATLLAVQQRFKGRRPSVVGIEKPEAVLHPTATAALLDALNEGALDVQVIVTSHSADLLDVLEEDERLLIFASEANTTRIGPPDSVSASSIQDKIYGAGELLRMDYLQPAAGDVEPYMPDNPV